MLVLLTMILLFHALILLKVVPYNIAWGGRLKSDSQMYVFEFISVLINLFLAWVLLLKANVLTSVVSNSTVDIILWVFLVLFIANTIGNLLAKTMFEKYFSLLTLILAALIFLILRPQHVIAQVKSSKNKGANAGVYCEEKDGKNEIMK